MLKVIENTANFLIICLPLFLVTGPLLSDLSVVILDIIFLVIIFSERKYHILNSKYFSFLILLWLYFSFRSLFADDIFLSFKSSFFHIRFIILIWAISFFFERNNKLIYTFSKIFIFAILFICIDALIQYFLGTNIIGFKSLNSDKLNGMFGDEAVLGSYLIRLTPLIFAILYFNFDPNKFKLIYLFTLLTLGLVIFLSGSRSSLFLFFLFSLLFFFINTQIRKSLIISFVAIALSLTFVSQFNKKISHSVYYNLYDPIGTIFLDIYNPDRKNRQKFIFTKVYDTHYRTAYKMFDNNKFFGVGTKMYRKLCNNEKYYINEYSCTTHPHNFYLQLLAENGFIGFFGIFSIFLYILIIIIKKIYDINFRKEEFNQYSFLMILVGIFINLWPIVPSGNFFNNWLSIVIFFPISFLIFFSRKKN